MRISRFFAAAALAAALLPACSTDPCDAGDIADELADAEEGDVVEVGACEVHGAFVVPAGVTLRGAGRDASRLVAGPGEVAVTLTPGGSPARLEDLTVATDGRVGVLARGAGAAGVARVTVLATRGVALGADGLSSLDLADVTLAGPAIDDGTVSVSPEPTQTATHGAFLNGVGSAQLTNVVVTAFASVGLLAVDSTLTWNGGSASANAGAGIWVDGGHAALDAVEASDTFGSGVVSAGVFATGGASVETRALAIHGGQGYGLVTAESSGHHVDLSAEGNGDVAVWTQASPSFEISGDSKLSGNRLAGVVVVDSAHVSLDGLEISATALATEIVDGTQSIQVGDGIQLVGTTDDVRLANLRLNDNGRIGLSIDLAGGSGSGILIDSATVSGSGGELGAIMQGGTVPAGWDANIEREGETDSNDASFTNKGDELGMLGPNTFPPPNPAAAKGMLGPNT